MNNNDSIFNCQLALEYFDGDEDLLKKIIECFIIRDCPNLMQELRKGVEENNVTAIQYAAHTIKGASGSFGADSLSKAALSLENIGKNIDLAEAMSLSIILEAEIKKFVQAFEGYKKTVK